MKTIFEQGAPGHGLSLLPACDVPVVTLAPARQKPLRLPQVSENELIRHYTALSHRIHGMNDGFYPLGSCTMKYNPKVNEALAALPGFARLHPLQPEQTAQGALELLYETGKLLGEVTGMDAFTLQPAAGAHGEFTGLLLIKAYHLARGDAARTEIIVPDSAHGTNPASSVMAGFRVVNIPSGADGCVDLAALLLRRAARTTVAEDKYGLARRRELRQLILRRNVHTIVGNVLCRLAAAHQSHNLVTVDYGHALDRDLVPDLHLARGLAIAVVHHNAVVAYGLGRVAARLEHTHGPQIFVQSYVVHILLSSLLR